MRAHRTVGAALLVASGFVLGVATWGGSVGVGSDVRSLALASLGLETLLGAVAIAGALLTRLPVGTRLGLGPGRAPARDVLLLLVGTLALSHGLDGVLEHSGLRARSALALFEETLAGTRGADLALALLALALAPALGEELLCRGLVQRGLEARLGAPAAVGTGALVFGLLHVEPIHGLFAVALGAYLGAAAWIAGSVRVSIGCHLANNALAVVLAAGLVGAPSHSLRSTILGLAVAAAALLAVAWRGPGAKGASPPSRPVPGLQQRTGSDDV